jgi:hypothetical protein
MVYKIRGISVPPKEEQKPPEPQQDLNQELEQRQRQSFQGREAQVPTIE